jgi:hypothetical protein
MNRLEELIKEYTHTFKENFPIYAIRSAPESEIIHIIEKSLNDKVPYMPGYKKNTIQ